MAIDEGAGHGDVVVDFGPETNAAASIRTIDCTVTNDPIDSASSHVQPRQTDPDGSDSSEGNPLLVESAAVTIDASIGKPRRNKAEDTMSVESTARRKESDENFVDDPAKM